MTRDDRFNTYASRVDYAKLLAALGYPEPQTSAFLSALDDLSDEQIDDLERCCPEVIKLLRDMQK